MWERGGVLYSRPFTGSKVGGGLNIVFGPLQVHYRFYSFKIEMYIKQWPSKGIFRTKRDFYRAIYAVTGGKKRFNNFRYSVCIQILQLWLKWYIKLHFGIFNILSILFIGETNTLLLVFVYDSVWSVLIFNHLNNIYLAVVYKRSEEKIFMVMVILHK